ncbi:TetR/AcrR family transcriptional regulator [Idiomarina aminovorans]|uniref:TetR/AcrR family transcriptional regulator n=1 Tax=Idiomarina aminovorans TaxID=2914829 RepID=UPI00200461A9|nr:TetR/AcrR family transcriptional regulator [Idiomarina sp. ATCH4]MCK7458993.1 TetR/AcrR family transcriptional regulator [Idiomarina sp. ATCH4]
MVEKKAAGRPSNRDVILDAADRLVAAEGAAHLTFDALSHTTGISKGGLLYHFNSKDCLLQAMLKRRVERYENLREQYHRKFSDDPKGELKSILLAALDTDAECSRLGSGMLAAAATNPELLGPLKEHVAGTLQRLERIAGSKVGKTLFYAVHGARLFEQLNLCDACVHEREDFAQYLLKLADELTEIESIR